MVIVQDNYYNNAVKFNRTTNSNISRNSSSNNNNNNWIEAAVVTAIMGINFTFIIIKI